MFKLKATFKGGDSTASNTALQVAVDKIIPVKPPYYGRFNDYSLNIVSKSSLVKGSKFKKLLGWFFKCLAAAFIDSVKTKVK